MRPPDLERGLVQLGRDVQFPPTPGLAAAAARELSYARRRGPAPRRVVAVLAALLLALGAVGIASPGARRAVARWLGVAGIRIEVGDPPHSARPLSTVPDLGVAVPLEIAQEMVDFQIRLPRVLGEPDAVFVDRTVAGGMVTLGYDPAPVSRRARTGFRVIVSEFVGSLEPDLLKKVSLEGTRILPVEVAGERGYWLSGRPHLLLYTRPEGEIGELRVAGRTLVWTHGEMTVRLEAGVPLTQALEIAESLLD